MDNYFRCSEFLDTANSLSRSNEKPSKKTSNFDLFSRQTNAMQKEHYLQSARVVGPFYLVHTKPENHNFT